MLIRTEQTPNPATLKFLPGQTVMEAGTRDFADAETAEASPLAKALFDSGMVEGVFYGRDFISVTAAPAVSWTDLEPLVLAEYVRLAAAKPLTTMDTRLFDYFYGGAYCAGCRWHGERQICRECHYAGNPINFAPFHPEAAPPLPLEPPAFDLDAL